MNPTKHYIYLCYIIIVTAGLGTLIFIQNSDIDENIDGTKDSIRQEPNKQDSAKDSIATSTDNTIGSSNSVLTEADRQHPVDNSITTSMGIVLQSVPFTPQAPFAEWGNIIYQEGCEEATTIMAIAWAMGKNTISPEEANTQILAIADFEQKEFGTHIHASIHDIATTMSDYLRFSDYMIVENISKSELIQYIRDGHIVMVPTSGRDLKNNHYTPPGPRNHMILIIGYDPNKNEFITNDSGTKSGASYRYNEDVIFSAIGYYATSATDSGSLIDKTRKSGIIITKVKA